MENFIIKQDYNILYLIGPKGTSKSLFLSYFFINYNMIMDNGITKFIYKLYKNEKFRFKKKKKYI